MQPNSGMPDGAITGELQAHTPDALTERVTEYEATLDAHIAETRTQLASLPDRPDTQAQRKVRLMCPSEPVTSPAALASVRSRS